VNRLARSTRNAAIVASGAIALVGVVGGAVRLLPWLLDPAVPWRVAAPFARGLGAVALEAAILVGWPVGWALASFRFAESGEALVLQALGERPAVTVARLYPQGAALAAALAAVALVYGSDASAPGRVATELVAQARVACQQVSAPSTYSIPFTEMTWLCAPGAEPRLAGSAPGFASGSVVTARGARIAGDFRALELDDARVLLAGATPVAVHVETLSMHGMAPWARASTLPAPLRSGVLALSAWLAASIAAYAALRGASRSRVGALVIGAAGPLAALGLVRAMERADARPGLFVLVPLAACAAPAAAWLGAAALERAAPRLSRLRRLRGAATNSLEKA
jgi:hypothetical protein